MTRKNLISAVQQICSDCGYNFRTLDKDHLPAQTPQLPAAVLIPPNFRSISGRNHGRITYAVTLYLFRSGAHLTPEQQAELMEQLESEALEIFSQLSVVESVATVDNLTLSPQIHSRIGRAEVSLKADAEVEIIF